MSAVELVIDIKNAVGESPVWHAGEQALYWVDIPAKTLHFLKEGQALQTWQASEMIGCIAPHASGGWIAGMESGIFHLQPQNDGSLQETRLASLSHPRTAMRANDGRCDRQGRFLFGAMYMNMADSRQEGCVTCYQSKSELKELFNGLYTPNGMAFSPDGRTMYHSDSHPKSQLIWAWDYDKASGTPSNRRVFVDMNAYPGRPDGAAVDEDGCYWICGNDAGLIHRFTPQGKLDRSLAVPVKKPAMCAFGGADMKTLYVTSIRPSDTDLADQPLAGGVFALHPGVRGLPEPFFQP
ncbi:MAG: SMP-30/gluconolactonase/LRE family protein [Brachymonas sp.]|nr:SMP-30/gluconolactonase/LRE family protein [Brachymonas sp.]